MTFMHIRQMQRLCISYSPETRTTLPIVAVYGMCLSACSFKYLRLTLKLHKNTAEVVFTVDSR